MTGRIPRWQPPGLADGLLMFPTPGSDAGDGRSWPARRLDSGKPVRAWIPPFGKLSDPVFRARWLRQAAAARELADPHLVPLEAVGGTPDRLYLQEAEPDAPTLADLLRSAGPMGAREAAIACLHAARGLKALHAQGFAHGRVDADHLVRDPGGLTRLVGLGREGAPPLGTGSPGASLPPLPEPDALRADLHGLGQTFLTLLAGPDADPGAILRRQEQLPRPVATLIDALLGEKASIPPIPDALTAVTQLEALLAAPKAGTYLPREDVVAAFGQARDDLNAPKEVKWRRWALLGFYGGLFALALLSLLFGLPRTAIGWLGLAGLGYLARLAVAGVTRGDDRWYGLAAFLFGGTAADRLSAFAGLLVVVAAAFATGLFGVLLAFAVVAAILAVAEYVYLGKPIQAHRERVRAGAAELARTLRDQGLDESELRRVVSVQTDPTATTLYPLLFGPAAARRFRLAHRPTGGLLDTFGGPFWSDRLMDALEHRLDRRRDLHLSGLIRQVEEARLEAQKVHLLTARRRSRRISSAMLVRLSSLRLPPLTPDPFPTPLLLSVLQAAEAPELVLIEHGPEAEAAHVPLSRRLLDHADSLLGSLLGARTRFLLGALLLAGFLAWASQNDLWNGSSPPPGPGG